MRPIHTLPLAAAILLAACGGSETDADGDGELSADEVAAEAEGMVQPRPGQYRTTLELVEFEAPGMPDSAKQQLQQALVDLAVGVVGIQSAEQMGGQQLLHVGIHRAAGVAELHDRAWRSHRPHGRCAGRPVERARGINQGYRPHPGFT